MRAQRGERRGAQVLQPGAAVDQQGLGEDPGQPVAAILAGLAAVAPAVAAPRWPALIASSIGAVAEDQLGQVQPVEVPRCWKSAEPAEQ